MVTKVDYRAKNSGISKNNSHHHNRNHNNDNGNGVDYGGDVCGGCCCGAKKMNRLNWTNVMTFYIIL